MNAASSKSVSRGRPRSDRKRREIMQAAIELFTRNGFDGTSVDDVASAAGVSKQTVYSHYGSKENLFGLAISTKCRQSGIDPDGLDLTEPPELALPKIARQFAALVISPEAVRVHAVCTGSSDTHPELGRLFFNYGPRQAVAALEHYLRAQQAAGRLRIDNPSHAAWQFLSMLKAEAQLRVQFRLTPLDRRTSDDYVDSCVAMFLRAYAAA